MTPFIDLRRDPTNCRRRPIVGLIGLVALVALSACQTTPGPAEGIGFREARFQEISAMEAYRSCVDDAMKLDADAREKVSPAGYLASARLIDRCESELGPEAARLAVEERMRAYALGIVNYARGGDLVKAQENLGRFRQAFAGQDLYLPNGASFVDTMDLLTGRRAIPGSYELSMLHVGPDVGSELERLKYWDRN